MSQNPSKRARHGPADASSSAEATPPDEPAAASSSAVATLPDEPAAAVGHSADNTMTEITFVIGVRTLPPPSNKPYPCATDPLSEQGTAV